MSKELDLLQSALEQASVKSMLAKQSLEVGILSESEKRVAEANITIEDAKIIEIRQQISDLEEAEASAKDAKCWAKDKKLVEQAINKFNMGYLIGENKIVYCSDFGITQSNAQFIFIDSTAKKPVRIFEKLCDAKLRGAEENRIADLFAAMGKSYETTTTSFNKEKWDSNRVYNYAEVIMRFWIKPDVINHESYNKDFDILMHCVGGGKKENIDHLEQWLGFKYCHPEAVANTPNLDIGGNPGGNGKGLYATLAKTIFTQTCVVTAAAKEISAGFNANWANAVIIHYDEPEENELPNSKIKNATGSDQQRIEKKGIDAYMADRNYSILFTSNNENGVARLTGTRTGEDRRYSVLITNIVLTDYLMETEGLTFDDAKERTNQIAQLVKDDKEVAKWLGHVMMKHNCYSMIVIPPLHGIDYANRFEDQKNILQRAFDSIYPVFMSQGMIPDELLLDLVHVLTDNTKYKIITVRRQFENYLKNKKHVTRHVDKVRVDYTWGGGSNEPSVRMRTQKSIIALGNDTSVAVPEVFALDLISSKNLVRGIMLDGKNCTLTV